MCIRDSGYTATTTTDTTAGRTADWTTELTTFLTTTTATTTVSYTHLRAHETVLDLVCRLLLEKKKQEKTELIKIEQPHHNTRETQSN